MRIISKVLTGSAIAAAALALSACATTPPPAVVTAGQVADAFVPLTPADVLRGTTLDEKVGLVATRSYTTATRLGTIAARAGLIDKAGFKVADQKGYAAVLAIRAGYDAGNAASYSAAINQTYAAVAQIAALSTEK